MASYNGVNRTAFLSLYPGLRQLVLDRYNLTGGSPTRGTVDLDGNAPSGIGGVDITLTDSSSAITTPSSVHISGGGNGQNFTVSTSQVNADAVRFIFAELNGVIRSRALTLTAGPRLTTLGLNPTTVQGGHGVQATVTLDGPAPVGVREVLITDNSSSLISPPGAEVLSGNASVQFNVQTQPVQSTVTRQITVTQGGVTRSASVTLTP